MLSLSFFYPHLTRMLAQTYTVLCLFSRLVGMHNDMANPLKTLKYQHFQGVLLWSR